MSSHRPRAKAVEPWHTYKLIPALMECRKQAIEVMRAIDPNAPDYKAASELNLAVLRAIERFAPDQYQNAIGIQPSAPGFSSRTAD